jgi:hypothetical protein
VDDDLVALAAGAAALGVGACRVGERHEGFGVACLPDRTWFRGTARLVSDLVAHRVERPQEDGAVLGREAAVELE